MVYLEGNISVPKNFCQSFKGGFGFCNVIFGWDANDELYQKDSFTGWADGFSDALASIDLSSWRKLPTDDHQSILLLADFSEGDGAKVCPRSILKKVLETAKKKGYSATAAFEFEFFLFDETPKSIREKEYKNLKPFTPGNFGYSVLRNSSHASVYHEKLHLCENMGMQLEGLHTETGPGVLEGALRHSEALRAADNAALFKTFTKVWAQQNEMNGPLLWQNGLLIIPGNQVISIFHCNKKMVMPYLFDEHKPHQMSDEMRWFIGGQQQLMPEVLAMVASTCNSYTRLIPGFWAPTQASWGVDNRTCALRAITGSEKSQRVEYRISAADINPHLALAAAIGTGIWGIEHQIEPTEPVNGNAYEVNLPAKLQLPKTLSEAALLFRRSKVARQIFGNEFVDHYAMTREWEDEQQRRAITDWQLNRYFEII